MNMRILFSVFIFLSTIARAMKEPALDPRGELLIAMARWDTPEEIRRRIEMGFPVNYVSPHNWTSAMEYPTPLKAALYDGKEENVRLLIEMKAQISDSTKFSMLSRATIYGWINIMDLLFESGVSVNVTNKSETFLEIAMKGKNLQSARWLLDHNARVNDVDKDGETPLSKACYVAHKAPFLKLLIEARGQVNFIVPAPNRYIDEFRDIYAFGSRTPLMNAALGAACDSVRLLIAAGAHVCVKNDKGHTPLAASLFPRVQFIDMPEKVKTAEIIIDTMLQVPNQSQIKTLIAFLGVMKRKKVGRDIRNYFKPLLLDVISRENRIKFSESVACHMLDELPDSEHKTNLQKKYSGK